MIRPLLVFGTRPEAIKLAPLVRVLQADGGFEPRVCVTAQHRQMLDQVLKLFDIEAHHDLDVMQARQTLFDVTSKVLLGLGRIIEAERPDVVVVQGDTTTVFAASLAAYYHKVPVAHVEAGLRTGDKYAPFPEEMNRLLTSSLSDFHFAPTEAARRNLLVEAKPPERVWVTGNTIIDALLHVVGVIGERPLPPGVPDAVAERLAGIAAAGRIILVTGHRRESFGAGMENIARALRDIAERNPDIHVVYPVHLNPNVREPMERVLGTAPRVHLLDPLPYAAFVWLMMRAHVILTDSGGIQEEAPALGKPVLVMRDTTERPEAVEAGTSRLVGTDRGRIVAATERLLQDPTAYRAMATAVNPFGDGTASKRIVDILRSEVSS